jgi:hypothetical protein
VKRLLTVALIALACASVASAARAPHLTVTAAKHAVREGLEEGCAGECTTAAITACIRKSASLVFCRVRTTYASGESCRASVRSERIRGEGAVAFFPGGTGGPRCEYFLYPPELREVLERQEGRHSS